MKSLTYLFRRGMRPIRLIFALVLMIGMTAAVIIFHEPVGSEDYLVCKLFLFFAQSIGLFIPYVFLFSDINGNRVTRSMPFFKELKTVGIPLYTLIMILISMAITLLPYAIFILASGAELFHLSDALLLGAAITMLMMIMFTLILHMRYGSIVMIYIYFPVALLPLLIPEKVWESGFGVDISISSVLFAAALVLGTVISFVISRIFYKKADFKPYLNQLTTTV